MTRGLSAVLSMAMASQLALAAVRALCDAPAITHGVAALWLGLVSAYAVCVIHDRVSR